MGTSKVKGLLILLLLMCGMCQGSMFWVGPVDPNFFEIPPANQEQLQRWKKLKSRLYKPVIKRSPDQNGDGVVDFKDLAIIGNHWLEKIND